MLQTHVSYTWHQSTHMTFRHEITSQPEGEACAVQNEIIVKLLQRGRVITTRSEYVAPYDGASMYACLSCSFMVFLPTCARHQTAWQGGALHEIVFWQHAASQMSRAMHAATMYTVLGHGVGLNLGNTGGLSRYSGMSSNFRNIPSVWPVQHSLSRVAAFHLRFVSAPVQACF